MIFLLALAHATLVARGLDPEALAALSTHTAYGDVIAVRTERTERSIFTVATVQSLNAPGTVDVRLQGGCHEGICLTVAGSPTVREGERIFVFLRGDQPTSFAQGFFVVEGNEARRDVRGLDFREGGPPAAVFPLATLLKLAR